MIEKGYATAPPRSARIMMWTGGFIALTIVTLLAGVGIAAVLGRRGNAADWDKWSNVGQTFGVLSSIISSMALAALVITARVQFREMYETHRGMEKQHDLLNNSLSELQRTADASDRKMHFEILKMAINDPKLAEVWPPFLPEITDQQNRQFLYANIIYQYQLAARKLSKNRDDELLEAMSYLFASPIMRDYWRAAERAQKSLATDSEEFRVARKVDKLWHEYEADEIDTK